MSLEPGRAREGHVEMVRTLLEAVQVEAQTDRWSEAAAQCGAQGCAATTGALLELGVHIHAVDASGLTPLQYATSSEAVQTLLGAGADLQHRTICGTTPLFEAVRDGDVSAVAALVQAGSCPNAATPFGGST